ncbi:MAG: proteasome protein, partial [Bacteroidota bacterium]
LAHHEDWIVLSQTMATLAKWAMKNSDLRKWLVPHVERLSTDSRKSVSGKAKKVLAQLQQP